MVTLKDIAAEAGVSITTVSNVVHNRKSRVSAERIAKIWEIIEREHYVPSMTARSLANDHSSIIGMVTHITPQTKGSTVDDPFLSSIMASVEQRARDEGYYLMRGGYPSAADRIETDRQQPESDLHEDQCRGIPVLQLPGGHRDAEEDLR